MNIGIYQVYWGRVGGGQRYIGAVAEVLSQRYPVEFVHHCQTMSITYLEEALELDLSKVNFRYIPRKEHPVWETNNPLKRLREEKQWYEEISEPYDLFIDNSDSIPFFCHAKRGVLVTHFPLVTFEEFHGHTTEGWEKQPLVTKMAKNLFHRFEWKRRFSTYDLCLASSRFCSQWMKRLWDLDAEVVYPPIRNGLCPQKKENLILSISAFDSSQHKKHEINLETFKTLCRQNLTDWKYIMVGAVDSSAESRAYLERLRNVSKGYAVEIYSNVSGLELKSLLERASLLWHAMGYGVDEKKEPRLMEHFGMVVAEAMATGCIPIVFDGGGLREIVSHGQNGFLWSNLDDLRNYTLTLIRDVNLRHNLSNTAVETSKKFSRKVFESRLLEALAPVLE